MRYKKNIKLRKDSDGTYYNPDTGFEFDVKGKEIELKVSDFLKKSYKKNVAKLKRYNKKYGVSVNNEIKKLDKLWNDYVKYIDKWNSGEVSKLDTVKYHEQVMFKEQMNIENYYTRSNIKKIKSKVEDDFKVELMRINGRHGVFNGKAYDDYLNLISKSLNISVDEVEELIFPTKINEKSTYDDIKEVLNEGFYNVDELLKSKVKNKEITRTEAYGIRKEIL